MSELIANCRKHGKTRGYKTKERIRCYICNVDAVTKRRKVLKIKAIDYKGGKCCHCNYNKCVDALEFHHTDPSKKDFGIGHKGYTRAWEKVKEELDKCVLLCANCHREEHEKLKNIPF